MARKVIILTGAPESTSLDWDSPDLLLQTWTHAIARFAGLTPPLRPTPHPDPPSSLAYAAWRSIPLRKPRLRTGFSQHHDLALVDRFPTCNAFFAPAGTKSFEDTTAAVTTSFISDTSSDLEEVPTAGGRTEILSQFYEHSLAAHDDIPSSQLGGVTSQDTTCTSTSTSTSTSSSLPSTSSTSSRHHNTRAASVRSPLTTHAASGPHLSDLEDIPSPSYLLSISPQTVTANLIAGVISIAHPRTVTTRWGQPRSLIEVLIGDDTRSGFAVTFWVSNTTTTSNNNNSAVLATLRNQDVVLMQNVALHVFRNKVYGSSLRKDLTKVHVLYRRKLDGDGDGDEQRGHYSAADLAAAGRRGRRTHPQLQKTRRVRDWVLKFVGQGPEVGAKRKRGPRTWDMPPPHDTQ